MIATGTTVELVRRLRRAVPDERVHEPFALGSHTTYRVGGDAAVGVRVVEVAELVAVADAVADLGVATVVVGKGSNLLVADAGFDGLAVVVGPGLDDLAIDGTRVRVGGGASLPIVARRTAAAALTGFEWAVGVPGTIGGAVRMNAGGHGADIAASLARAEVIDLASGERRWWEPGELALGYRRSALTSSHVVIAAELSLAPGDPAVGAAAIDEIVRWRRANQPGGPNAGSVFTNPPGDSAGRLIDAVGAKGLRVGSAEVSVKHANFIQADSGGSADDVLALMRRVRRRVRDVAGIELEVETVLVGFELERGPR